MPLRRIYRVENKSGEGPYRAEHGPSLPARLSNPRDRDRPSPLLDGASSDSIPWPVSRSLFAFKSKASLAKWFGTPELESWLAKNDYRVATYEIPDYQEHILSLPHQIIIDKMLEPTLVSRRRIKPGSLVKPQAENN